MKQAVGDRHVIIGIDRELERCVVAAGDVAIVAAKPRATRDTDARALVVAGIEDRRVADRHPVPRHQHRDPLIAVDRHILDQDVAALDVDHLTRRIYAG